MTENWYQKLEHYFLCFMVYSFAGWIYELSLCLIHGQGFVNRGFDFGPYLPIYGFGGILILYIFNRFKGKMNPALMCILISIFAAGVELVSTYLMQLAGITWSTLWNYNGDFLNFQGRIAPWPALKFGLLGILFIYVLQPHIDKLKEDNSKLKHVIVACLFVLFMIDCVYHLMNGSNFAE